MRHTDFASLLTAALLALPAAAADPPPTSAATGEAERAWGQWRGPRMDGTAPQGNPPLEWSESRNVRVKVEVPGEGVGSPVVWGDHVFLTTAIPLDPPPPPPGADVEDWQRSVGPRPLRLEVLAYSRQDGRVLWRRVAGEATPPEGHHQDGTWASASAVTDGTRVVAHFGSLGTYAFTFDGEPLWSRDLGDMRTRNAFGEGSSPALDGDTLVIPWDHEGDSFLVALDVATGAERWRVARPGEQSGWATPLVVEHGGRKQVVLPGTGKSRGYDFATGAELWSVAGMTMNVLPTPVHRDGLVVVTSGFRGNALQAIDLAKAKGDLAGTLAIRYTFDRHTPYVPSPLLYEGQLHFLKTNTGILTALDFATGAVRFTEHRLEGVQNVYASPVGAAGRIYVVGRDGATAVLAHGPQPKHLATNVLADRFDASPTIVGGDLVLRGRRHLYVLAEAPSPPQPSADR